MTPEDPPKRNDQQQLDLPSYTGLAQRAGAILQRMEQCNPLALINKKLQQHQSGNSDTINSTISPITTGSVVSYQNVYSDYPHHLLNTKFALPSPTRAIYNMVLLSYRKELGPIHIAQQAEDIIWSMIIRAMHHQSAEPKYDESKDNNDAAAVVDQPLDDALFPTLENWNCILECWLRSTDTNRAFHAFLFLLSWKEWNKQYQQDVLELETKNDMGAHAISHPSMESFDLVLQSCLVIEDIATSEEEANDTDVSLHRAKDVGSSVAIRLWNEMQNSNITSIDSAMYYQIIHAICQSSELPSTQSSSTRPLAALARVYTKCCTDGTCLECTLEAVVSKF